MTAASVQANTTRPAIATLVRLGRRPARAGPHARADRERRGRRGGLAGEDRGADRRALRRREDLVDVRRVGVTQRYEQA